MNWVAISGTWKNTNEQVEKDVHREVAALLKQGDGIVVGGALGVDLFALDEVLTQEAYNKIKVCLPVTLSLYATHYRMRAQEGVVTKEEVEHLIHQLELLYSKNPNAFVENTNNTQINKETYFERNTKIAELSSKLIAFQVNKSEGTQDTIDKACGMGKEVRVFEYTL